MNPETDSANDASDTIATADLAPIRFDCTACSKSLEAGPDMAGASILCPSCNANVQVPLTSGNKPSQGRKVFRVPRKVNAVPPPLKRDPVDRDHSSAFGMEDGGDLGVKNTVRDAVTEFKQLDYNFLVPLGKIFSTRLLRLKAVRWVLLFGLYPFVLFNIYKEFKLQTDDLLRMIELYFCTFWALYFYGVMSVSRTVWKRGVGYAIFTTVIGIPLLLSVQTFPIVRSLYAGVESMSPEERAVGFILGVGPFEEICKALPLLFIGLNHRRISGPREGVFLGLMSGLGFALSEGVLYMLRSTILAAYYGGNAAFDQQLMTIFHRAMAMPLLHAAWAGTVGWFIGVAAIRSGARWPIITLGIALVAIMHGLYDVFANSAIGTLIAGLSFIIFMAYMSFDDGTASTTTASASASMPSATASTGGEETVGELSCRSCGYAFPKGNKFCPACGVGQGAQ